MIKRKVEIDIQQNVHGHWLIFKDLKGNSAMINIENVFHKDGITDPIIRQWARDQFNIKKGTN